MPAAILSVILCCSDTGWSLETEDFIYQEEPGKFLAPEEESIKKYLESSSEICHDWYGAFSIPISVCAVVRIFDLIQCSWSVFLDNGDM